MYELHSMLHWRLFIKYELTIFQHWSWWLGADQATRHYLNQLWLVCWRIYASLGLNELTTGIVPSQCPPSSDAERVIHCVKPLASGWSNAIKLLYHDDTYLQWSRDFIESDAVHFDINEPSNPTGNVASDWHGGYGVTRSPSFHKRLLAPSISIQIKDALKNDYFISCQNPHSHILIPIHVQTSTQLVRHGIKILHLALIICLITYSCADLN